MNPYLILTIYIIVINIFAFFAMKLDKDLAKKQMWRISEKALFSFALFLGAQVYLLVCILLDIKQNI